MIRISNELYYGNCRTAVNKGLAVAAITVALVAGSRCAAQETVLHTFVDKSGGYGPGGGLTLNANGDLFGTASFGREPASIDGTVFINAESGWRLHLPNNPRLFGGNWRRC